MKEGSMDFITAMFLVIIFFCGGGVIGWIIGNANLVKSQTKPSYIVEDNKLSIIIEKIDGEGSYTLHEGDCIMNKDVEFEKVAEILKVVKIGKKKALVKNNGYTHSSEIEVPIEYILHSQKKVACR